MAPRVHPTAVVDPEARLADGVVVGPLCLVGPGVELGEGTELVGQATVLGPCRVGRRNRIFPHAVVGSEPQDRSHAGEATMLLVGDDNVFRESVTIHRGTKKGGGVTRVGSGSLFMAGTHVAHDCTVGDGVTFANLTTLGGHVVVEDRVVTGGHVAVAPFVRLGELSFAAGGSMIERDVPPFVVVSGDRARVRGVNRVGLERAGIPETTRKALERAYLRLWAGKEPLRAAAAALAETEEDAAVRRWLSFVLSGAR